MARRRKFLRTGFYQSGIINLPAVVGKARRNHAEDRGWTDSASLPGEAILDAIRENA